MKKQEIEALKLSQEETQIINDMMEDNKEKAEQEKKQQVFDSVDQAYKHMKKLLKLKTKSQLIEIIWTYGLEARNMQHALQVMLEENKELKEKNSHLLGES
tara:strand:+ start:92 stop:394 length:303 start_codon:yes stop_codon:yes gene_type:complete